MAALNPYLNFNGNAEEAFNFYKSVFGGEFSTLQRFKDTPEGAKTPANEQNKIIHVALPIGNGTMLMASDVLESMKQKMSSGNNVCMYISAESEEETQRIFNGLSAGGKIGMPLQKTFWDSYFGSLTDQFGIQWMIGYDYNRH